MGDTGERPADQAGDGGDTPSQEETPKTIPDDSNELHEESNQALENAPSHPSKELKIPSETYIEIQSESPNTDARPETALDDGPTPELGISPSSTHTSSSVGESIVVESPDLEASENDEEELIHRTESPTSSDTADSYQSHQGDLSDEKAIEDATLALEETKVPGEPTAARESESAKDPATDTDYENDSETANVPRMVAEDSDEVVSESAHALRADNISQVEDEVDMVAEAEPRTAFEEPTAIDEPSFVDISGAGYEPTNTDTSAEDVKDISGDTSLSLKTDDDNTNPIPQLPEPYEDSPSTIVLRKMGDNSLSRKQWILRKERDHKDIEALDKLMSMYGLESVKAHFLWVYDQVHAAKERGDDCGRTITLGVCFVGAKDSGKTMVAELYIKLLASLGLVSYDTVARTVSFYKLSSAWDNATEDSKRGILYINDYGYWDLPSDLANLYEESSTTGRPVVIMELPGSIEENKKRIPEQSDKVPHINTILLEYTADEMLAMLISKMKDICEEKGVEGGWDGVIMKRFLTRAKNKATSRSSTLDLLEELKSRRFKRVEAGEWNTVSKPPGHIYFTRSDMLGLSAEELGGQSKAWAELQQMIGMTKVKEAVRQLLGQVALNQRLEMEGKPPIELTFNRRCFIGPPGTGKTTAANLYGRILSDLGLLYDSDNIVEKRASDLIGCYVGWSEDATKKAIDSARGGVLIIDDFHLLLPDTMYNTGKTDVFRAAVIDTIVANIDPNSKRKEAVILIGYPESMAEAFDKANPGLARRFPLDQAFRFSPYNDAELAGILDLKLRKHGLQASDAAIRVAKGVLSIARHRPNFGNGGDVENLLNKAKAARNERCANVDMDQDIDMSLQPRDFDAEFDRDRDAAQRCVDHFRGMQGMTHIMEQFQRYQSMAMRLRERGHDPRQYIPWALVFQGPPGTGKTTVARKISNIYYDMGFLAAPEIIECSVADLTSPYVGESGKKVIRIFERALGKVLFIDEAYRLGENNAVDAIGEMVDCMTKERFFGNLVIVLAGYKEDMENLMRWNRGLRSRFATHVDFKPMGAPEALALLQTHLDKVDIVLGGINQQSEFLSRDTILSTLSKLSRAKSWSNGRDVVQFSRIIIEEVYTDKERYEEVSSLEGRDSDRHPEVVEKLDKKERKKILFHADDLIPLLNRRLNKARVEDEEMGVSPNEKQFSEMKRRTERNENRRPASVPEESLKTDSDDSEYEEFDKSIAEARNPDDIKMHYSIIDFLGGDFIKRVLFNLSRYKAIDKKDEKRLEKVVEQTMKLGNMGPGAEDTAKAQSLVLKAMLCWSRSFLDGNKDENEARQYLEEAHQLARRAVNVTPPNSTDGAEVRNLLSEIMYYLCTEKQLPEGIEAEKSLGAAIVATREALKTGDYLLADVSKRDINARLGHLLQKKYDISEEIKDLNEALECMKLSLATSRKDEEDLPERLQVIIDLYFAKILGEREATDDEIKDGIDCVIKWLELVDDGSVERMRNLTIAGRFIAWRSIRSGDHDLDEIDHAIELQREGISLAETVTMSRDRQHFLRELFGDCASTLVARYEAAGSKRDLDDAVELAIKGRDMADTLAKGWKCTLALLRARNAKYELTLDKAELDASVKEAEAILEVDDLDREAEASMLEELCGAYTNRFRMNSNMEDIEKAIEYGERMVKMYPRQLTFATHLGVARILLWERTQNTAEMRKAMTLVGELIMEGGGIWNRALAHMVKVSLLRMYRREKKPVHLDYAVQSARIAVSRTSKQHGQYEMLACNLADCLLVRYESNKKKFSNDLDEAIGLSEESIKQRMTNAYYRSISLQNLGLLFQRKYEASESQDKNALYKAIGYYTQGQNYTNADTAARIKCGRAAANLLGILGQWRDAADILMECVRMLPRVTGLASGDINQQRVVARYGGLASACVEALMNSSDMDKVEEDDITTTTSNAKNDEAEVPYGVSTALRYLELGRSVISRLSLEQTVEVDLLRQEDSALADEYVAARTELYTFAGSLRDHNEELATISPMVAGKYKRQVQVEDEYEAICKRIRKKEGFSNFLLPPRIADIQAAAGEGTIIVINVGKWRSDAFMITKNGVVGKQLNGVDEESVACAKREQMPVMLDWLWRHVALPILRTFPAVKNSRWPRVWWVLTGPLTGIPIHAAGSYGFAHFENECDSERGSVLDRVMSSYATSIMALLYGRRVTKPLIDNSAESNRAQLHNALLVSMSETPGKRYPDLPNADQEVRAVEAQLRARRLPFKPVTLVDKTTSACLSALQRSSIFHFAGHGKADRQVPSRSALLLLDHETIPLTMEAVRDARNKGQVEEDEKNTPLFLAYLSACSTGAVGNPDLVDEAIHLVAGMQLARFRHVVGTLWEVSDWYCVQVAVKFYKSLPEGRDIHDDDVCRALHEAIREIRDGSFEPTLFPANRSVTKDMAVLPCQEEGQQLEMELSDANAGASHHVALGETFNESQGAVPTLAESGPSRVGIGIRPSGFVSQPPMILPRSKMDVIQSWAPYVHYGV